MEVQQKTFRSSPTALPSSFNSGTLLNRLGWPSLKTKTPIPNFSLTCVVCLCVE